MADVKIIIEKDQAQLAGKGAELFCREAAACLSRQNHFAVAISGGSTPRGMHRRLALAPYPTRIAWRQTELFWVDERMVPYTHAASNYGTALRDFLNRIPIPPGQIHPMPAQSMPEEGADLYQQDLAAFFQAAGSDPPVFDLIFLGVGNDGHTASLFPGPLPEKTIGKWVLAVKGGKPDTYRLTLSFRVLNLARHIVFLVSGSEKAPIVRTILSGEKTELPAAKIRPENGRLTWMLDEAAASLLPHLT